MLSTKLRVSTAEGADARCHADREPDLQVINLLPRTPHMFEEQTSWKLEEDPHMRDEIWRENYEPFAAECEEGLMEKLDIGEARKMYGDKIATSSLSVLVEETHGNKKRTIHDATHGTKVNRMLRQTTQPGCTRETVPAGLLQEAEESGLQLGGWYQQSSSTFLSPSIGTRLVGVQSFHKRQFYFYQQGGNVWSGVSFILVGKDCSGWA